MKTSVVAFRLTVGIGAFLLFLVQPMAAKFLLPWFGGSTSVWSTCLLFFQAALLAGYVYAHLTQRLGPSTQAKVHIVLLLLAVLTLPIIPSPAWKPLDASHPAGRILVLLTAMVGLPYVLLAATAPMVQSWLARAAAEHESTSAAPYPVYWLYALSNLGSLVGLLAYPAAIERLLSLRAQAYFWSAGFVVYGLVCTWAATRMLRVHAAAAAATAADPSDRIRRSDMVLWILLSCAGAGLLLAATNELCQDIAVVPLLWIVPLTAYLLTFILCFSGLYRRWLWMWALLAAMGGAVYMARSDVTGQLGLQAGVLLALLFSGCMVCHGELVAIRPASRHLTAFYLAVAAGGGIGGVAVALVAPLVFDRLWEYQIFALLPFTLLLVCAFRDPRSRLNRGYWRIGWLPLAGALAACGVALVKPPPDDATQIARARNFYGVLTVLQDDPGDGALRTLKNGRILHGTQFIDPARRSEVTSYYGDGSGVELAIDMHPRRAANEPLRIGVVGLGAGTIAALGHPGDIVRFFEINPVVVDFARRYFTFLADSQAHVEIVGGDARLSLERELRTPSQRQTYDVFAIDAFSGDAIPVHLLTREAFALYWDALREDGILAVHVSNRYLDLTPVVRGLAAEQGKKVLTIEAGVDDQRALESSTWMLVTGNADFIDDVKVYANSDSQDRTIVWTDAFSSLLQVLKRR